MLIQASGLTFVANAHLDLSQYTRNYALMMVLSVPTIEVTAPHWDDGAQCHGQRTEPHESDRTGRVPRVAELNRFHCS